MERVLEALRAGKLDHLKLPKKDKGKVAEESSKAKTFAWQKEDKAKSTDVTINMVDAERVGQRRKCNDYRDWELIPISFPPVMSIDTSNEPIIVKCRIPDHGIQIKRMHVDTGSGVDIMYEHCYCFLPADVKAHLRQPNITLSGFSGESSWPLGRIELVIELADDKNLQLVRSELINFYVVRSTSCYNALIKRNFMRRFNIIPSVVHGLIKFPTMGGISTIASHQATELCGSVVHVSIPSIGEQLKGSTVIANRLHPDKRIKIGACLSADTKAKLHGILSANADVFAWQESDMTGVPRDITEHSLNVNPSLTPVRQKKRHMALERSDWLCTEVDNFIRANILQEVRYQTWVASPVSVKKADGNWRMCIDFKDINKACPKDNYPLPEIDWKVESLSGFRYKCFLDAYKGYHQILMAAENEDKTAFHTPQGIYCYTKMPF
ncbi:uncharacterized protein [Rutidosis leptorrhynchoides]|uniref:uncharacterized protein n=1 Tax=Rutidosis leptorrhynchoides TaxID=125765 RepID=UPI003A98D251